MDFVEHVRVSQEGAETGFGAEIDRPAAILNTGEILRIGIVEFSPTEGDEAGVFLLLEITRHHIFIAFVQLPR